MKVFSNYVYTSWQPADITEKHWIKHCLFIYISTCHSSDVYCNDVHLLQHQYETSPALSCCLKKSCANGEEINWVASLSDSLVHVNGMLCYKTGGIYITLDIFRIKLKTVLFHVAYYLELHYDLVSDGCITRGYYINIIIIIRQIYIAHTVMKGKFI